MMKPSEALDVLRKQQDCRDAFQADEQCDMNCLKCEYNISADQKDAAVAVAISALEFRTRYDQFWEEVKAAGARGNEVEIHHSGRVFRIREVAQ